MSVDHLDTLQRRGILLILRCAWGLALLEALAMLLGFIVVDAGVLAAAIAINILPTLVALQRRQGSQARMIVGMLAAVHPAILVYLMRGHE